MSRVYIEGRNQHADTQRVTRWVTKWRKRLHITDWTIHISLETKPEEDPLCVANIVPNLRYHYATIFVYPHMWDSNFKEQERSIVHELSHIALEEVNKLVNKLLGTKLVKTDDIVDSFEGLAEWVTNVIWDAYEK